MKLTEAGEAKRQKYARIRIWKKEEEKEEALFDSGRALQEQLEVRGRRKFCSKICRI